MHGILACHGSLTECSASTSERDLSVMSCSPEDDKKRRLSKKVTAAYIGNASLSNAVEDRPEVLPSPRWADLMAPKGCEEWE